MKKMYHLFKENLKTGISTDCGWLNEEDLKKITRGYKRDDSFEYLGIIIFTRTGSHIAYSVNNIEEEM